MQRFFKEGLKFVCTAFLIYLMVFALLFFIEKDGIPLIHRVSNTLVFWGGDTYRKFREFNPETKYDLIVLGSSHAYNAYNPQIFKESGLKIFNLGTSGQSLQNTLVIAENYLTSHKNTVVVDLYPGTFMTDGLESTSDLIINLPDWKTAFEISKTYPDIRVINMFTLRFFYQIAGNSQTVFRDTRYNEGGFIAIRDSVKTQLNYSGFLKEYKPFPGAYKNLEKLILYCKNKGIKIILSSHPAPRELERGKYLAFKATLEELSKKHEISYLNLSFDHRLDSKNHFYDLHHLNKAGASIFSKMFIEKLPAQ